MSVHIALIMRKYVHTFLSTLLELSTKSLFSSLQHFMEFYVVSLSFSNCIPLFIWDTSCVGQWSYCYILTLEWFISILHVDMYKCYLSVIFFTWKDFYFHFTQVVYKFWWKFLYRTHFKKFSSKYNDQIFASESCP